MTKFEIQDCVQVKVGHRLQGMVGDVLAIRSPSTMAPCGMALMQRRSCNRFAEGLHVWETHPSSIFTEWISFVALKSPSWLSD
jgi:hypothetical protein